MTIMLTTKAISLHCRNLKTLSISVKKISEITTLSTILTNFWLNIHVMVLPLHFVLKHVRYH